MNALLTISLAQSPGSGSAATFWLLVLSAVLLAACAAALWLLVARARELGDQVRRVSTLDKIHTQLSRLTGERSDIDLRRIEHVLLDVRDGLAKVEGALLDQLQGGRRSLESAPDSGAGVAERIVNRLLALGYERVEISGDAAGPGADEAGVGAGSENGSAATREVLVEAYRHGVLHKGRVRVEGDRIRDVEMNPTYSIFP